MEATNVTARPEALKFKQLRPGKKAKLRRQYILDLIRSKPYGTPIRLHEFAAVAQLTSPQSVNGLILTLLKKGIISRDEISRHNYAYRVNGDVKVVGPADPKPMSVAPAPEVVAISGQVVEPKASDYTKLAQLAKDFYWERNSNDLHEFVQWLEQREGTHAEA